MSWLERARNGSGKDPKVGLRRVVADDFKQMLGLLDVRDFN